MTNPANAASREARLREALEPFAREAEKQERVTSFAHGDCIIPRTKITIGDLRRARRALTDEAASQSREDADDLDTPEARLDMVRAALQMIVESPHNAVPLAKAGLDMIMLTAQERAEMRGDA